MTDRRPLLHSLAMAMILAVTLPGCGGGGASNAADDGGGMAQPAPAPTTPPPPAPQPLQVLVPAYFYPVPGSHWEQLARSAQARPTVHITAIVNPSNGPGNKADAQFTQALAAFTQAGGKVIGYVRSNYGKSSQADIQKHIERYLAFYGRDQISGFFIDEMTATGTALDFYRQIHAYIKGLDANLQVVGNPGTLPIADYAAVADTLVTFEGSASAYASFNPLPNHGWVLGQVNSKQAMLVHDANDCRAMQASLGTAASERGNTGWVYATNLHYDYATDSGNPWAALPAHWERMLDTVDAINQGRPLPDC
ncbi:MAG: spherulation-specific family 4 protein [Alicycliphilus sp.]|jgi:hypothetical protein